MAAITTTEMLRVIRLRNTTDQQQELWMEPLGDRVLLSPNVLYEVVVTDALEEIDFSPEGFVVFGWVKSVAEIDDDGNKSVVWDYPTSDDNGN